MSKTKSIVAFLLILSVLPALGSFAPLATGQSLTTITTLQIVTTSSTISSAGTYCFLYSNFKFTAQQGQQITTTIGSSIPIDFYVLTDADYNSFNNNPKCDLSNIGTPLAQQQAITNFDLSFSVPNDGSYDYVFINKSLATAATVTFGSPTLVTVSLTALGGGVSGLGDITTIAVMVVVAVVALGLGYFAGTRRGRTSGRGPQETVKATSVGGPAAAKFCVNCGASLPSNSKFCSSCGATQQ